MAREIALLVEYDGTGYHGFQIQKGVATVQGEIEKALLQLTGERVRLAGASRTDAGVHARGQVVTFRTGSHLSPKTFIKGLNFYLPEDIAIKACCQLKTAFSARRKALSREYRYTLLNSAAPSPLWRRYAHRVTPSLNLQAMGEACRSLVGRHDFAAFAPPLAGSTVRKVHRAELSREGELVFFDMTANSFLPQQVRRTVGALIEVGTGKMDSEAFPSLLEQSQPGLAGPAAPPHGLCLMKVNYPEGYLDWEEASDDDL